MCLLGEKKENYSLLQYVVWVNVAEQGSNVDLLATHIFLLHIVLFPICSVRCCYFRCYFCYIFPWIVFVCKCVCALIFRYVMNFQRERKKDICIEKSAHMRKKWIAKTFAIHTIRNTKIGLPWNRLFFALFLPSISSNAYYRLSIHIAYHTYIHIHSTYVLLFV